MTASRRDVDHGTLPDGAKFATVALPDRNGPTTAAELVDLGNGDLFSRFPLAIVEERFARRIGTDRIDAAARAGFYLSSVASSSSPEIADTENKRLIDRVYLLYAGLMISADYFRHGWAMRLTGAMVNGQVRVQGCQEWEPTFYIPGSPRLEIRTATLQRAASYAEAIRRVRASPARHRFKRILNAFLAGLRSGELDRKVHQFVRSVGGFVCPKVGSHKKHFAQRAQTLVKGDYDQALGEMYSIRSTTEHLSGPLKSVSGATDKERKVRLIQRAVQAETLARFFIASFLRRPELWPLFPDNEDVVEQFWMLEHEERRRRWGLHLDMAGALREFSLDRFTSVELDQT